ncbi:MFS transporter [Telmatobacter bradus]|uniref:MFS transporter n=1 Tax=Telmatobacter bradus TaxID=474953 RepID=UPI003B4350EA
MKKPDTRCGFGAKGWTLIALEAVLMWISSGSVAHGLNVILPAIASTYHLDYARLLALATPASWTSVLSGYFGAKLCQRKGAKFLIVAGLLLGALSFGLMGNCGSLLGFAVLFSFVCIFDTTFAFIGGPAMLANWFPRKSTLAMGWATMGQSISTATYVPLLAMLFGVFGVRAGFWGVPALMVVVAILFAFFVTEMPANAHGPADASLRRTEDVSRRLTTRQLLGMKDVWLMGLSFGCVFIMVVGLVSQMVPRLISLGVSQPVAIRALSLAALAGMPGAWAWGWLGQRYGVKKASIIYAFWNACAILLNIVGPGSVLLWVSLMMIGFGLSGATNLSMSIVATKFPGEQFVAAWSVINPIQSILRCCAFAIIAFGLTYLGGFTGAYMMLGLISLIAIVLVSFINTEPFQV